MANLIRSIEKNRRQHSKYGTEYVLPPSEGSVGRLLKKEADSSVERFNSYKQRGTKVPPNFLEIIEVINKSKKMLDLKDNWDDEGSPAYLEETWNRAVGFLVANAINLWNTSHMKFDVPKVLPGPDGSIDIHWKTPKRSLLVNVPVDFNEPIDYYGNNDAGQIVKGDLKDEAKSQWLMMWLMQ